MDMPMVMMDISRMMMMGVNANAQRCTHHHELVVGAVKKLDAELLQEESDGQGRASLSVGVTWSQCHKKEYILQQYFSHISVLYTVIK